MTNNIMFKVGDTDYSDRVISGTYAIQNVELYTSWEDGNFTEHRHKNRDQIQGTFDMFFLNIEEYKLFCQKIKNFTKDDMSVPCVLFDNRSESEVICDCFIEFNPTRRRNDMWQDEMEKFDVKVKEK